MQAFTARVCRESVIKTLERPYSLQLLVLLDESPTDAKTPTCLTCFHPFSTIRLMIIASCMITLQLEAVFSLKEKRRILKSILNRLPQKFNVAVAEVDHQDVWGTAVIGLVTVGNDAARLHSQLQKAVIWLEKQRPDVPIADYEIEILT